MGRFRVGPRPRPLQQAGLWFLHAPRSTARTAEKLSADLLALTTALVLSRVPHPLPGRF